MFGKHTKGPKDVYDGEGLFLSLLHLTSLSRHVSQIFRLNDLCFVLNILGLDEASCEEVILQGLSR